MTDAAALALNLFNSGKYRDAEHMAAQVIAAQPGLAVAYYIHGLSLDRQGRVTEARQSLKKAVSLLPKEASFRAALVYVSHKAGLNAQAMTHAEAVLKTLPTDQLTLLTLANAQTLSGDLAAGLKTYGRILAVDPANVLALGNAARLEGLLGQDAGADAHLAAAAKIAPQDTDIAHIAADLKLLKALRGALPHSGAAPPAPETVGLLDALTPADGRKTSVVFFHIAQQGAHPVQKYQAGETVDYIDVLGKSVAAARLAIAGCRIVLLTDSDSVYPDLGIDVVARLPAKRDWIMYERLRMQQAFSASALMTENVLFLDTDIMLNRSFKDVFAREFDVGLTWRANPLMPINGGMILGKKGLGLQAFLTACLSAYEALPGNPATGERYGFDVRAFQGDQLALAAAVNWQVPPPASRRVGDARVTYFSCEQFNYNFSPARDPDILAEKYAVHFKGGVAKGFAGEFLMRKQRGIHSDRPMR